MPELAFTAVDSPSLTDGDYTVSVTQTVSSTDGAIDPPESFSLSRSFTVAGPRFRLAAQNVAGIFPPAGSLGGYSDAQPHVLLRPSTLPWERRAAPEEEEEETWPWLVLLSFTAGETPATSVIPLGELRSRVPALLPERGEDAEELVNVIEVERRVLEPLLPSAADLPFLAHVRQTRDGGAAVGDACAAVVGNRLGVPGERQTVHLVSVEGRYTAAGFDWQGAGDTDAVTLVTLERWSFDSDASDERFLALLEGVHGNSAAFRLELDDPGPAASFVDAGFVALPHRLRNAGQTVSWYHGPLVPAAAEARLPLPADAADALLVYDEDRGLFDVAYAAAWELGRLLALESRQFSLALYHYQRAWMQERLHAEQMDGFVHLPVRRAASRRLERSRQRRDRQLAGEGDTLPPAIADWLAARSLLDGLPFNYLVPDPRLLPVESIRFFQVDPLWIDALFDGAWSLGRLDTPGLETPANPHPVVSGFLLRSDAVAGWPTMLASAAGTTPAGESAPELEQLALRRLSDHVLLGLFAGTVDAVTLRLEPETLHFGVIPDESSPSGLGRPRRDGSGTVPVPLRDGTAPRVIDVAGLAAGLGAADAAAFAVEMITSSEGVTFRQDAAPPPEPAPKSPARKAPPKTTPPATPTLRRPRRRPRKS